MPKLELFFQQNRAVSPTPPRAAKPSSPPYHCTHSIRSIVALTFVLIFILLLFSCGDTYAQDRRITIHPNEISSIRHTIIERLPDGEPTCCEHEWNVRYLHYHPASVVPRRMYHSACNTDTNTPSMFTSVSLGENRRHPEPDPSSGAIIRSEYDPATGRLIPKEMRRFKECIWSEGIATSSDCSTIAMLCRRNFDDKDFDFDSLATHKDKDWMTQPKCAHHSMWLYEWNNGDIMSTPRKYVVHRSMDFDWEYGNNYLRYAEDQNVYGIGMKARVFGGGGCHEADAFLVLNRTDYHFTDRGYAWACGTGHTIFNRPVYNEETGKFALMCGTDGSNAGSNLAGYWFRREDLQSKEFFRTNFSNIHFKGGPGALLPMEDGGYLGILVGVNGRVRPQNEVPQTPPTSIGLVRFDSQGDMVGAIKWVAEKDNTYLSHPQLAKLGTNRFLLGYGEMKRLRDAKDTSDESYRIPWNHYLLEIDANGNRLTDPIELEGAGWGEQDEMVSLGNGRVGWAYIPDPTLKSANEYASCNSKQLQLSVYGAR
ncbi:MAG: hypothetical protein KDK34_09935 [Leptospiraceae bacterium]|nr:hypothetical protein [Leptospiraceae bacterium]